MNIIDLTIKIASFLTAIGIMIAAINKFINKNLKKINNKIYGLEKNECKNFLVNFLTKLEKKEEIYECQKLRAYELYNHYINDLDGNSFIKDRLEKMMNGLERIN